MGWMAWTAPTAAFFVGIALMLTAMTVIELVWPTERRRGWLPIPTTRGDRLFISLITAGFVHLAWLATTDVSLLGATALALLLGAGIMARG